MTSEIHSPSARISSIHQALPVTVLTSMKHESVHSDLFVARNANAFQKTFFVAQGAQCAHEPAVSFFPLSNIARRCALDEELWFFEDVLFLVSSHQTSCWNSFIHTSTLFTLAGLSCVLSSKSPIKQSLKCLSDPHRRKSASILKCGSVYF